MVWCGGVLCGRIAYCVAACSVICSVVVWWCGAVCSVV